MKNMTLYVGGLGCAVTHTMRVQMRFSYDPAKLKAEIKAYAKASKGTRFKAREVQVTAVEGRTPNLYDITFAYLEAKEEIEAILDEIDFAVAEAKEITRLLDLTVCDSEEAGLCGER